METDVLSKLSKEQLEELVRTYARNMLALDGVWFQSIEQKLGMDEAMLHDARAWERFTVIEARRIKKFLGLPEYAGLGGLKKALSLRFYANINEDEAILRGNTLLYRTLSCRVQNARARKNMEFHPCKPVGEIEYAGFARTIDPRVTCTCVSCYPQITDDTCACSWLFTLHE